MGLIILKNKTILMLIGVIIIIIGVFFSLRFQPEMNNNSDLINSGEDTSAPEDQFTDVELVLYNSDASISWLLKSDKISNYNQEKLLSLLSVKITAFRNEIEESTILYYLTGDDLKYDLESGIINLTGPIDIIKDEIVFRTGHLQWQDRKDTLSGSGGIIIQAPDFLIKGENMEADLGLNNIIIDAQGQERAYFTWERGSDLD